MTFLKRRIAMTVMGAVALATLATTATAQTVTLRLHQMLPPQATIPAKALIPWAQKVEAESGGKIKVQLFHAMQLGARPRSCLTKPRTVWWISRGPCWATPPAAFPRPKCLNCPS